MASRMSVKLALTSMLLVSAPALAQADPAKPPKVSDKLPPANPLPYEPADVTAVMAPVNALIAALAAHDVASIQPQLAADGRVTVVSQSANGANKFKRLGWPQFLAEIKPTNDKYEVRLSDPAVESDGHVALVWSPYVFYLNGKPDHCGTDHFDLVKQADGWKIANMTWSQRTANCGR